MIQLALEIVRDADLLDGYKWDRCHQFGKYKKNLKDKELKCVTYDLMSERVLTYYEKEISTLPGKMLSKFMHRTLRIQLNP